MRLPLFPALPEENQRKGVLGNIGKRPLPKPSAFNLIVIGAETFERRIYVLRYGFDMSRKRAVFVDAAFRESEGKSLAVQFNIVIIMFQIPFICISAFDLDAPNHIIRQSSALSQNKILILLSYNPNHAIHVQFESHPGADSQEEGDYFVNSARERRILRTYFACRDCPELHDIAQ
jgi:hypothetical protein